MKKLLFTLLTLFALQPLTAMEPSQEKRRRIETNDDLIKEQKYILNIALFEATKKGDHELMQTLIAQGADINFKLDPRNILIAAEHIQYYNDDALKIGIDTNQINCCELLIKNGAIVRDNHLNVAAKCGSLELCDLLLSHGAEINPPTFLDQLNINNFTPLMWAARKGNVPLCDFLLKRGACINGTNYCGVTALISAAESKNLQVCEFLLNHGADVNAQANPNQYTALVCALPNLEICKLLIKYGANPNHEIETESTKAARSILEHSITGILEMMSTEELDAYNDCALELIKNGARVLETQNRNRISTLMRAAISGNLKIFEIIVQAALCNDAQNISRALKYACAGMLQTLEISATHAQNPNLIAGEDFPSIQAISTNYFAIIHMLQNPEKMRELRMDVNNPLRPLNMHTNKNICHTLLNREIGK